PRPPGVIVRGTPQAGKTHASTEFVTGLPGNNAERDAYLGLPLVLIAIVTAVRWGGHPPVRVAASAALVMLVCSMGDRLWVAGHRTSIPLPWAALSKLPLTDSVITSRLALYTSLFVGGLLA